MCQLETALKGTLGNLFSSLVLVITTPEYDELNALVTALVQLIIAIATFISLLKKRQNHGKN